MYDPNYIYYFRRRLSAEVAKPEFNKRWKLCSGYVCMHVSMPWRVQGFALSQNGQVIFSALGAF